MIQSPSATALSQLLIIIGRRTTLQFIAGHLINEYGFFCAIVGSFRNTACLFFYYYLVLLLRQMLTNFDRLTQSATDLRLWANKLL